MVSQFSFLFIYFLFFHFKNMSSFLIQTFRLLTKAILFLRLVKLSHLRSKILGENLLVKLSLHFRDMIVIVNDLKTDCATSGSKWLIRVERNKLLRNYNNIRIFYC